MDRALAEAGIRYFLVDAHGILNAFPTSPHGVHAPVVCPSGVAAFGRDLESSKQVWSSEEGYPGDGAYREFYRDLGYDASYDYIEPYLHDDGVRRNLGLKYYRVTGRVGLHEKQLYDRAAAVRKAVEHGGHFVFCRQHQLRFLKSKLSVPPIVVAPYDAELFGHWWYEGPEFLEAGLPRLAVRARRLRRLDALRVSRPASAGAGLDAEQFLVGRQGILRGVAQRRERLDLSPPAQGRGADGGTGAAARPGRRSPPRRSGRPCSRRRASCSSPRAATGRSS